MSLGKVETVLKMCQLVDNICAYADSSKQFAVCLAVPNTKQLRTLADSLGISADASFTDLCNNKKLEAAVLKELQALGRKGTILSTCSCF